MSVDASSHSHPTGSLWLSISLHSSRRRLIRFVRPTQHAHRDARSLSHCDLPLSTSSNIDHRNGVICVLLLLSYTPFPAVGRCLDRAKEASRWRNPNQHLESLCFSRRYAYSILSDRLSPGVADRFTRSPLWPSLLSLDRDWFAVWSVVSREATVTSPPERAYSTRSPPSD